MPGQLHWQAPSAAEDHVMWSKATNTILWGDCQEWTSNRCEGNDENSSFHKWKQIIKASETCKRPSSTIFVYFFNFQYTSVLPWKLVEETLPKPLWWSQTENQYNRGSCSHLSADTAHGTVKWKKKYPQYFSRTPNYRLSAAPRETSVIEPPWVLHCHWRDRTGYEQEDQWYRSRGWSTTASSLNTHIHTLSEA